MRSNPRSGSPRPEKSFGFDGVTRNATHLTKSRFSSRSSEILISSGKSGVMSYLQAESSPEWLSNGSFNALGWFFQSDATPQISPSLPGVDSQKIFSTCGQNRPSHSHTVGGTGSSESRFVLKVVRPVG